MSTPPPSPAPRRRMPPVWVLLAAVLLPSVVALALFALRPPGKPESDMPAAMAANTRGVGLMERFDYADAVKEFAEAVRLAPDWPVGKVNLGMALFNQQSADSKVAKAEVVEARRLFNEVLAADPDNRHAHYCLGVISQFFNDRADAHAHYAAVNRLDPADAFTWLNLGATHPDGANSAAAGRCYEKALALDPYLNEARYKLAFSQPPTDAGDKAKQELLAEFKRYEAADFYTESKVEYSTLGPYAEVIRTDPQAPPQPVGPLPGFAPAELKVALAAGARWATAADLDPLRKAARERFGGTIVLFDFNRDGRPDVLLLSAVVENGAVRDLLLRNDGANAYTDVTAAAGLAKPRPSLGAAVGDSDNDGLPDVVVTGAGEQHLFRNKGDGTFADVSAAVGLDRLTGVYLGCAWADLDPDMDLDLILCRYADKVDPGQDFGRNIRGGGGGLDLFENVGVALPGKDNEPAPPLTTAFRRGDGLSKAVGDLGGSRVTAVTVGDLDGDRDLDLLLSQDDNPLRVLANDRLGRFRNFGHPGGIDTGRWVGGLVFAGSHGTRSDLFVIATDRRPSYAVAQRGGTDFGNGTTDSPPLKQAMAVDVDLDGWTDVVGLTADGQPALLHNRGNATLAYTPAAFGAVPAAVAATCADLDGDQFPDLLLWTDKGLELRRNAGNGNKGVAVEPSGRRNKDPEMRSNGDGIGVWVTAQTGSHWAGGERATVSAGLGQSLLPLTLGLGRHDKADALLVRWPDLVTQAEVGVPAGAYKLVENNRKTTSCPVLMTWDGERFVFVTDFLGGGALGERGSDGSVRPPRPEESVKIEPHQLRPKDGQYVLKIAEPMDEVMYADRFRLDVIDHPPAAVVYPDERFVTAGPPPSQELLAFTTRYETKAATDDRGRDVLDRLKSRDGRAVDGFAVRSWLGYAEDHALTVDFGDLAPAAGRRWFLVLAGWTEYPYPESMHPATRAGVALAPPVVERLAADGTTWEPVCDLGFPAGLTRVMTRELPGFGGSGRCVLRIRTNMQVYWDHVFLAPADDLAAVAKVTPLEVSAATLAHRGFVKEVRADARSPLGYDDGQTERVAVTKWAGRLTRLGDVTDLLRATDDRFVLCGPGDEVTVRFDAAKVPPLPAGWTRSFVLRSWGYCKDTAVTTVTGGRVGPLPFRGMPNYPDFGGVRPPETDAAKWHTRPARGR